MSGKLKDLYVKRNQNQYQPAADSWEARAAELSNMSGGAMQQGETAGNGAFGWLKDSFDAGVAGVFGGTARLAGEFMPFGNDTLNSWADYFDDVARRNSPQPGQNLEGIDYVASAVGNALGSGAASALEAGAVAGLGSLLGAGGVAGTVLGGASKVIPGVGKAVQAGKTLWGSPMGKYLVANVAGSPFEAASESGNLISDMRKENQQGTANYSDEEIRDAAIRSGALNLAWLTGMNMLEAGTLGKITGALGGDMAAKGVKNIAKRATLGGLSSGIGEGAEEYGQNLIGDYSKRGSTADFNYDEALEAAKLGAIGGGVLGGVGSGLSATFSKKNSDVAEEIASEDGGTIEETPEATVSGREAFINAIAGQESGGNYNAENGDTGAYGKYQIMPSNWPAWAEEAGIGADAPRTPENQEIVARFKLGQYYDKYGARGAAIAWYGGEGALNYSEEALNRKQGDNGEYPSINEYADEVLGRMGNVADSARIDDTEENYFDESNYTDDTIPDSLNPVRGFDVSHLDKGTAQDRNSLLYGERVKKAKPAPAGEEVASFNQSLDNSNTQKAPNSLFVNSPRSWDAAERIYKARAKEQAERKARAQAIVNIANAQQQSFLNVLRNRAAQQWDNAEQAYKDRKQDKLQSLANVINARAAQKWDAKEADNTKKAKAEQEKQTQLQSIARLLDARAAQQWDNAERDANLKQNQAQALANLLNAKAAGQYDVAQQVYANRAKEQAEKQRQQQAIANIINARAAQKFDEAETADKFKFVPQRQSMYDGAIRRNLAAQDKVKPEEQPSVEATERNGAALDKRNMLDVTLPKVREQHKWDKEHKEYHAERYGESALPQTQLLSTDRAARRNMPKPGIEARSFINDRAEKKSARERMQDAIAFVWGDDPKHPLKSCRRQLNMFRDMRKEYLQPIYDVMAEGAGNGVSRIPIIEFDNQHRGRFYRQSNNSPWYAKYFKEHKKKPTQKAMYDIAEEVAFGENADVGYYAGVQGKELEAIVAENHAQLDPINDYIQTYESLELRLKENPNYGKEQAERINKAEEARRAEKRNAGETASAESIKTEAKQPAESNQDKVNKKAPALAEGYTTESGRSLDEADENEFILHKGEKNFGEITKVVAGATDETLKAAPIRLQVGNAEFGLKHLLKHEAQMQSKGFKNVYEFIDHVLKNFNQVYSQQTEKKPNRFVLYCKDDKSKGFMPIDLELKKDTDGYYTIVSAMPHKAKIKGTLVYDGSSRPSTATTDSLLSSDTNGKGGDDAEIVLAKPNVPLSTQSVAQPAENVKKINLPKGTTVDVSIVGDNSNIIQVKFNGAQGKGTGGIMGRAGYIWKSDKQVWQARKTEKAMDVAEQLGYTEEAKPQERDYELERTARQQRLQESNERATQSLIAQNKDESVPGKRYTVRNKFFSVTILDGVIRVTDASKINPQNNRYNFSLTVEEYQRAAQNGNRLAGISKLLKAKIREGIENWIEESPNERTKEVRKQQNDEAQIVQATDEHFENAYPLIEKVLQKAGIEALDHQTLFERAKKKQNQGKQEYKYYLNARPADVGTVPKGFIRVDTEDKGGRYGAIYYDRQLNDTDVQQYELKSADDVEKEKQTPKKFMSFEAIDGNGKRVFAAGAISTRKDRDGRTLPENEVDEDTYQLAKEYGGYKDGRVVGVAFKDKEARDKFVEDMNQRATNTAENVVESNKDNTNEGGNNNGIDITGKLSSNDTGSRRAENEIRTTSSSEESSGSNGQGSRTLEGQSGRNGNNGVPGSRTAVGGKTSTSKGSEQVSAVRENPARSAELSGSVVDSLQEQPNVDEGPTDKIVESVADGRTDAADTVSQKVNEVVKENNLDRQRADRLRKTAKVMPFLSKIQFSNTDFVADRLADNGKQGVMITDGTGTGKTFSGLAVAKEMVEDGKENILIVTPSDSVNNQWANAAKDFFGIELSKLDNIQDAGKGAVITTYANLGANDALIKRDWDLVICDESHYLMNNEQGEKTAALAKLRQLTLHPRELRARAEERILPEKKLEARRTIAQAAKLKRKKGQLKASEEAIVEKAEKLKKEKADELSKEERVQVEAQVKDWEQLNTTEKPKVMFMSATPFAYVPDIDYAEGYLFDYPKVEGGSYNQPGNGFQQFMIEHFGYHMRYNKLTKPDKAVDNAVMEVEFHEWLRKTGALTGHELEIDKDYNRGFLLVDQGVGKKIDEGFEFLRNNHDKYRELEGVLNKQFDSRRRNYLLESIKARESVPIIQQYLKAGKKVVVFYETNVERESFNPFKFTQQTKELLQSGENRWTSEEIQHEMDMFAKERPDLVNLNLDELSEPISIYREAFGDDAMFFNGRVSKNKRAEYVKAFNDDNSGKNLIFVQQDAGNAGISLHDTTGKHQRVLINIGIPRRPSYAIQIEGRIYRLGNKSNAIIRYLTTATNIENGLFAETVAGRASTAENLALGRRARGLRDSFKNAYQEIFDGTWEDRSPGIEGEDVGGKENDRNIVSTDSDYDRAKAFYFARGKKTAKNKAAEGVDYFATPEPVGYKMVQWAGLKDGDRVLEPSAGHGAISRFFSPNTDNTIIEPSSRLAPQAQMNTDNAKLINGYFEDLHIGNKYDAVTMNPPFGTGGKTAVEHVAKAFKHLRNGGRVIAIIPRGAMADKRFDAWYESDDAKDAHMVGEVLLPGITFERAGTKVATRIVIIDKGGESQGVKRIDLSRINNINELFDNLESVEMPARQTKQADAGTANFANSLRKGDAEGNSEVVTADSYKHTKTGEIIPSAKLNANLSDEEYRKVKSIAGKNGGYYSRYAKAFLFQDNETGRDKFVEEVNGANNTQYSVTSEAVQRAKEEVEAEIRAAFPNGKVEYVNGVPTITLPNGAKFQYSIRKNLIVNAKEQKKADAAHGTSGARVQGYWKKFTGNGVQRMLAVSQNSERGTAFHEAMHAAADLALTEKEKNALYNYYQKQADKQGRDVNEVMADAYRDWVLARQRKSGTMFGKLWRKVKDFCTRIKAIFDKGAEVERIMQDIESGRVYERGANNHSVTKRIFFSTESINPNEEYIQGINDTDPGKVNTLAKSFEDKGYVGRPVLLVENGNEGYIALTGSHRIEAAKQADVDLKAIVLENNEDTAQLIEARDDDERENIAKQLYEEGAISKSVYDVIREENESNGTYYSVASPKHKIANAFTNTERKGVVDSVKDFFKEHCKSLYQDWFDKNNPLKGFDALTKATGGLSVYDQVQSLPATTAGMLKALTEGTAQHVKMANQHLKNVKMKYNVTLAMALEKIDKKQMDKAYPKYLAENGFDNWVNALGAYLGAERCLEMAQLARAEGKTYKFPKGLTEQECQAFVNKAPQQFKAAADIFYKVNDNVISIMEDAEVFSHDLAKTLRTKYRKYCPLLRDFSDTAAADSFIGGLTEGGRGIGNVSVPLKRINIEGSERGVLNPLETILKSYAVMLNRAERNKVALMAVENSRTADLHELIQEVPGTTADPKNCVFTVLINGKKKAYKTTQDLYGPIVGYNLPAANLAFGVARTAARMLRTGATMSPSFILRNVLRDTVFAGISSKNGFIPLVDTIRGAIALAKDPAMRAEFEAAGVTEYNFYSSQKSRIKSLDAMAGETPASAWEIMKAVFSRLEATSDFFESSTRMGEYMKARQKGLSMEEAARAAREVTLDFSRSGRVGEQVNQVVPFFNACLQGGDKMVRLFREDFVGTSLKVLKYIVLPSLLIMAMNWDEDWYKDLDPDIKNNYWCLGRNIRIPKPQEAGVLFGSGIEALFQQATDKDKDAVSNFLKAFSSNMMPSVLPTLILPLIEWSANYSFFKGRPLVGNKYSRLPDELQYNDYTSELSKGIGSTLKVSPMKIDNLVRGYTGTMGALLWSMAGEPFAKANNLPKKRTGELPFIRDFNVTDANLSRPMNEFYGILDKANRQHAGYGVKGKPEAAVKGIRSAGSMISKIRKDIDKITHSSLTPERKRELIDKRKEKMNQIAKQATARYGKYFE